MLISLHTKAFWRVAWSSAASKFDVGCHHWHSPSFSFFPTKSNGSFLLSKISVKTKNGFWCWLFELLFHFWFDTTLLLALAFKSHFYTNRCPLYFSGYGLICTKNFYSRSPISEIIRPNLSFISPFSISRSGPLWTAAASSLRRVNMLQQNSLEIGVKHVYLRESAHKQVRLP